MYNNGISIWFNGMALGHINEDESFIFRDGSYWHKANINWDEDQVWDYNSTVIFC